MFQTVFITQTNRGRIVQHEDGADYWKAIQEDGHRDLGSTQDHMVDTYIEQIKQRQADAKELIDAGMPADPVHRLLRTGLASDGVGE